ncbi:MAG: extracellular solute-binding protein [Deltaproteobacteria bacterium]|nr:extracellular solute-binding protein [Deltaproteobacteria bacterium]MBW2151387.1 extracellular solute-binding protein [Deltaproteobacteria bacterium]
MKAKGKVTRRQFIKTTALTAAAITAGPYVKTSHSAGKLAVGLWDHWIPGANDVSRKIIMDWGKKNGVEIKLDYITSVGFKQLTTIAAEARAKTGHDVMDLPTVETAKYTDSLEPMDDVVNAIISEYGELMPDAEYLGKIDGTWYSCPGPIGSHTYPMVSRLDLWKKHAGIDLKKIFPDNPNRDPSLVKTWTYDTFLEGCKKLHAAGFPFGNAIGPTSDAQDWTGPLFASFGSYPMDAKGNITFDSDETRAALEYMKKLTAVMPPDVYAWDDASNNRFIISGRGAAIQNPPSAWRVCVRDQPDTAKHLWHHDTPAGPKGRFRGSLSRMMGVWNFSKNKSTAKDLIHHLLKKEQQDQLIAVAGGYDIPLIKAFNRHPVWKNASPPAGTLYNYPIQGDEFQMLSGYPAPIGIAAQMYAQALIPNTIAKVCKEGKSIDDAIKWALDEIEGFMRG